LNFCFACVVIHSHRRGDITACVEWSLELVLNLTLPYQLFNAMLRRRSLIALQVM